MKGNKIENTFAKRGCESELIGLILLQRNYLSSFIPNGICNLIYEIILLIVKHPVNYLHLHRFQYYIQELINIIILFGVNIPFVLDKLRRYCLKGR